MPLEVPKRHLEIQAKLGKIKPEKNEVQRSARSISEGIELEFEPWKSTSETAIKMDKITRIHEKLIKKLDSAKSSYVHNSWAISTQIRWLNPF